MQLNQSRAFIDSKVIKCLTCRAGNYLVLSSGECNPASPGNKVTCILLNPVTHYGDIIVVKGRIKLRGTYSKVIFNQEVTFELFYPTCCYGQVPVVILGNDNILVPVSSINKFIRGIIAAKYKLRIIIQSIPCKCSGTVVEENFICLNINNIIAENKISIIVNSKTMTSGVEVIGN